MDERTVTLPPQGIMLRRLLEVDDDEYLIENFYLPLLSYAKQRQTLTGVIVLVELALAFCVDDMPPEICESIERKKPDIINALITDPVAALEAHVIYDDITQINPAE